MISKEFETALHSPEPEQAMREAVLRFSEKGHSKAEIRVHLENLLVHVRENDPAANEDAVLNVLDALAGWCHPDAQLLPDR